MSSRRPTAEIPNTAPEIEIDLGNKNARREQSPAVTRSFAHAILVLFSILVLQAVPMALILDHYGELNANFLAAICARHIRPALLLVTSSAVMIGAFALLRMRVVTRTKAVISLLGSSTVMMMALSIALRPFLPSLVLLYARGKSNVYNTMPCHFTTPALYFDKGTFQNMMFWEEWRRCLVPVSLFDNIDGLLRKPSAGAIQSARVKVIAPFNG